jgi:hypothetical protein
METRADLMRMRNRGSEPWYAAKTVYRNGYVLDGVPQTCFEERVVLFRAASFEDAIAKAEAEAKRYAASSERSVYLGFMDVYWLFEKTVGHATEVFSLMRDSDLSEEEYLARYYGGVDETLRVLSVRRPRRARKEAVKPPRGKMRRKKSR